MLIPIRTFALSALIGLGALAGAPAEANAAPGFGIEIRYGHGHRPGHWHGPSRHRHACTTNQALNKAHRMGIRHARVQRADRRVISVGGRSRGHHVRIIFARAPGCPVIR